MISRKNVEILNDLKKKKNQNTKLGSNKPFYSAEALQDGVVLPVVLVLCLILLKDESSS